MKRSGNTKAPDGVTRQEVLALLVREADMDGLAIVTNREIGEALGITQQTAGQHVLRLVDDGLLTLLPAHAGPNGQINALQLAEAAQR